jgi:lysophospholipase L1-like esterase
MAVVGTALAVGLLAASPAATGSDGSRPLWPVRYVALGDSYTELVPGAGPQTDTDSGLCPRFWVNYPHQVARELGLWDGRTNFPPADHAAFADASCGGALTGNIITGAQVPDDLLPQYVQGNFRSLPTHMYDAPDLVTLSIGGNDADAGIPLGLSSLFFVTCRNQPDDPVRTPCKDANGAKVPQLIGEIKTRVEAIIAKIHTGFDYPTLTGTLRVPPLRPGGHLLVIGYPTIAPSKQEMTYADYDRKCYVGAKVTMTYSDADWIAAVFSDVNNAVKDAAEAYGDTYVDTYTSSIGHDYCQGPLTSTPANQPDPAALSPASSTPPSESPRPDTDCADKRWIDPASGHPNVCEATNQTELIMKTLYELGMAPRPS